MKTDEIYLSFRTDRTTSELLKKLAKSMNMTQQELINNLCKSFVNDALTHIEEKLEEYANNQ